MHDLAPLTALGATEPRTNVIGSLTITEVPDVALASLAARQGAGTSCISKMAKYLGADLPGPGKAVFADPVSAIWMGPDQWMLMAAYRSHEDLADRLRSTLGSNAAVTEQSDAWACFDVSGPAVYDLSERLCAAPARRMVTADAQRSTVHHLGCFVICMETAMRMRFMGPRSSAGSLHHALTTAATSIA